MKNPHQQGSIAYYAFMACENVSDVVLELSDKPKVLLNVIGELEQQQRTGIALQLAKEAIKLKN